ncbi:Oxysterol-binding protein-related protein 9, partial [Microtus ochrogaster]
PVIKKEVRKLEDQNDNEYAYLGNYIIFSLKIRGINAEITKSKTVKNDKEQSPRQEEEVNSEDNKLFHEHRMS